MLSRNSSGTQAPGAASSGHRTINPVRAFLGFTADHFISADSWASSSASRLSANPGSTAARTLRIAPASPCASLSWEASAGSRSIFSPSSLTMEQIPVSGQRSTLRAPRCCLLLSYNDCSDGPVRRSYSLYGVECRQSSPIECLLSAPWPNSGDPLAMSSGDGKRGAELYSGR